MKMGERLLIIGKTGSGKTVRAIHALLDLHRENPTAGILVINHKDEQDICKVIKPNKRIPKAFKSGDIVHIRPLLGDKEADEKLNKLLEDVYNVGNTIVYIDEGLMIPASNRQMMALQTQGRSKKISIILLSQRPKFISLFAITQATEIDVFNVQGRDDIKTLENVVRPKNEKLETYVDAIPKYHYIEYLDDNLEIRKPLDYPIRGKIKPQKKPFPKLALLAVLPALYFLTP